MWHVSGPLHGFRAYEGLLALRALSAWCAKLRRRMVYDRFAGYVGQCHRDSERITAAFAEKCMLLSGCVFQAVLEHASLGGGLNDCALFQSQTCTGPVVQVRYGELSRDRFVVSSTSAGRGQELSFPPRHFQATPSTGCGCMRSK